MANGKLRIGILGAARIASGAVIKVVRERDDMAVTAVAARDRARAQAYAAEHAIPSVAAGYADLIARDDVDLVYVALPAAMHAEWSIRALESGKAVLCEKPFAMSGTEARAMVATARRVRLPLIEAFHYRHHNVLRKAFHLARSGALGKLRRAQAIFDVRIPYDAQELRWVPALGGGALMDLGCYCVHALRSVAGSGPRVTRASAVVEHGVDASTEAELDFGDGFGARLSCSMVVDTTNARLSVEGDKGSFDIVNFIAPQLGCRFQVTSGAVTATEATDGPSTFAAQLGHVADVLLRGADPLAGGEDAIANMDAIDEIYAAAGVPRPRPGPFGAQPPGA